LHLAMTSILVTGANGQLGSELRKLKEHYPFRFKFTDINELDLTDASALNAYFEGIQIDYIVNCAGYTAVDRAEDEPDRAMMINRDVVKSLLSLCKKRGMRLIHISTDYVFPGNIPIPLKETDPAGPALGAYALSKLEGEKVLEGDPGSIILRTSWLYSAFGNNFVKSMIALLGQKKELGVVFDQTGSPTYAGDLAQAILDIIQKVEDGSAPFQPGIYHCANEGVFSWYDFAIAIAELIHSECRIIPIETKDFPTAAPRPAYSVMNKNKIKSVYNIRLPYWRDSLKRCITSLS